MGNWRKIGRILVGNWWGISGKLAGAGPHWLGLAVYW